MSEIFFEIRFFLSNSISFFFYDLKYWLMVINPIYNTDS